jgi:hypothetical protein
MSPVTQRPALSGRKTNRSNCSNHGADSDDTSMLSPAHEGDCHEVPGWLLRGGRSTTAG